MFLDSLALPLMGTQLSYIQMYIKGWAIKRLDLQERSMLTDQVHRALSPRGPPVPPHIGRARRVSRGHTTVGLRGVYDFAWLLILPSNSITCLLHLSNSFLSSAFLSAPPSPSIAISGPLAFQSLEYAPDLSMTESCTTLKKTMIWVNTAHCFH